MNGGNPDMLPLNHGMSGAFTESLKDGNLAELPKRTQALHGLLNTVELTVKGKGFCYVFPAVTRPDEETDETGPL